MASVYNTQPEVDIESSQPLKISSDTITQSESDDKSLRRDIFREIGELPIVVALNEKMKLDDIVSYHPGAVLVDSRTVVEDSDDDEYYGNSYPQYTYAEPICGTGFNDGITLRDIFTLIKKSSHFRSRSMKASNHVYLEQIIVRDGMILLHFGS